MVADDIAAMNVDDVNNVIVVFRPAASSPPM